MSWEWRRILCVLPAERLSFEEEDSTSLITRLKIPPAASVAALLPAVLSCLNRRAIYGLDYSRVEIAVAARPQPMKL
jgi:hypothetical protein